MKIIYGVSFFALMIASSACTQAAKQNSSADNASVKTTGKQLVDNNNTPDVFTAYINLKNEFLKSDVEGVKKAAAVLESKLAKISGCSATATFAHQIATATDIKAQRATFLVLSQDVITLIKGAKLKTATIYVDHCPMADNGKGGDWLSLNKTIENPYFPEHMKECGSVKEQIN